MYSKTFLKSIAPLPGLLALGHLQLPLPCSTPTEVFLNKRLATELHCTTTLHLHHFAFRNKIFDMGRGTPHPKGGRLQYIPSRNKTCLPFEIANKHFLQDHKHFQNSHKFNKLSYNLTYSLTRLPDSW